MTDTRDLFDAAHRNCEAPWYCQDCEEPVCPRCQPSPGEFTRCVNCDWLSNDHPKGDAAMSRCSGHEQHAAHAHTCVGDQDHVGPHWCLLGHTWTDTENASEKEAS